MENLKEKLKALEKENKKLKEDQENLVISIRRQINFFTVDEYAWRFDKCWDDNERKEIDRLLWIYCLTHAIEIGDEDGDRTYPLTAWVDSDLATGIND